MSIWNLRGTDLQNRLIQTAIDRCDFPFEELRPSLEREGKTAIDVDWEDLSRYNHGALGHEHAEGAHTISREVDGRMRVLGLFYLPPYTRIVLERSLVNHPLLAQEVFLAEGAHAVDYHYMVDREMRQHVWNALHDDLHDLPEGAEVPESGDIGHEHSWFDGPGGYDTWVGEAFMEAFTRAFAPDVPVTIQLAHPVSEQAAVEIRAALLPPPPAPIPPLRQLYWSGGRSKVVHDSHRGIEPVQWFDSLAEAEAAGLRACRTCKPA